MKNKKNDLEVLSKYRFVKLYTLRALEKSINELSTIDDKHDMYETCQDVLKGLQDAYTVIKQDGY